MPPGLRKSGMPDSVLSPAPPRTTRSLARDSSSAARWRGDRNTPESFHPPRSGSITGHRAAANGNEEGRRSGRRRVRTKATLLVLVRSASGHELPLRHRPHISPALAELADDRRLEARVHEAVLAALVLALFPVVPVDARPELVPGRVVLLANQIAGALPADRKSVV